ncbi:hypothetical protein Mal52_09250 [Symmachiella dynata]|uniref:Nickel uptake substrate-specific transmembrane region n=1 Tax=Symmachiella dynata TaxID=2527995 RepID=A0A517ZIZ8_9PLAN|nr:hypothetical protein [Symmachiella dynata]QDU42464.1 hypothetical protein Mal52_09250 [Symmachiella dynata]
MLKMLSNSFLVFTVVVNPVAVDALGQVEAPVASPPSIGTDEKKATPKRDAVVAPLEKIDQATFKFTLVDEDNQPIAGVVVTPHGMFNEESRIHSRWKPELHGKIVPATTNDNGVAELIVPKYLEEDVEADFVKCSFDHPEFITSTQNPRMLGETLLILGRSHSKKVLLRGATGKFTAHLVPNQQPVNNFQVMTSSRIIQNPRSFITLPTIRPFDLQWEKADGGTLTSKRFPPETTFLRAVHFAEKGSIYFSDVIEIDVELNTDFSENLLLRPATRLKGALDESVPRPIRNGVVFADVPPILPGETRPPSDSEMLNWHDSTEIAADGTFTFENLPPSPEVRLLAICDGYISANPAINGRPISQGTAEGWVRRPRSHVLDQETPVEIDMEQTGRCVVQVTDEQNNPIVAAKVTSNLIFNWTAENLQIIPAFANVDSKNEINIDYKENSTIRRKQGWKWAERFGFAAKTDKQGIAILPNLPEGDLRIGIWHDDYILTETHLPIAADIAPGETTKLLRRMKIGSKKDQPNTSSDR